ncbi:MAG TPA: J domain-containing protein [Pyrinomonadaceae bacterium]|nr:J domain-containing protein [Pyrinomonadaceae bacterium]
MSQPKCDYYEILGADENTSAREIERMYKRKAARHHPDKGGSEEEMKSLNEAYSVLRDQSSRRAYDISRQQPTRVFERPVSSPAASDVGMYGHFLSALLCLLVGLFLLFLVRSQWIWFLWPLAILAIFVIGFGVLMTRNALVGWRDSLPNGNLFHRHLRIQEALFWAVVVSSVYGVYILLTTVQ